MEKLSRGFNLIEMMVVVAMIGILTSLSFPLYSQYLVHTHRLQAANILSKLALAMETFHLEHHSYEDASLALFDIPETIANNQYHLAIQNKTDTTYVLIASPLSKQAERDTQCGVLSLDSYNQKRISGSGKVGDCW